MKFLSPPNKYYNLMWDKRVLRGNTYATVLTETNPIENKPTPLKSLKASMQKVSFFFYLKTPKKFK